jgi:hypothetical protein
VCIKQRVWYLWIRKPHTLFLRRLGGIKNNRLWQQLKAWRQPHSLPQNTSCNPLSHPRDRRELRWVEEQGRQAMTSLSSRYSWTRERSTCQTWHLDSRYRKAHLHDPVQ